jgi:hypothetical protein
MKYLFIFSFLILLFAGCTQKQQADIEAEKPKVKGVVDGLTKTLETEDVQLFDKIVAHDTDMINFGTDAAERWVGYETLREAVRKQFDAFKNARLTVREQVIKVHKSGEVAWFSEIVDWNVIAMGDTIEIKDSRFTGVLEKRDSNWVIVQFHASIPVSGQAAQY